MIEEIRTSCIIDSGATGCIISKTLLNRISCSIEEAVSQKVSIAAGLNHLPLEMIFDLLIQFGKLIITIEAMVIEVDSYDLILGVDWLEKAKVVVNFRVQKMRIT